MSDEPRFSMHQSSEFVDVIERDGDGGDVAVVRYSRAVGSAFARQQARAMMELLNLREAEAFTDVP